MKKMFINVIISLIIAAMVISVMSVKTVEAKDNNVFSHVKAAGMAGKTVEVHFNVNGQEYVITSSDYQGSQWTVDTSSIPATLQESHVAAVLVDGHECEVTKCSGNGSNGTLNIWINGYGEEEPEVEEEVIEEIEEIVEEEPEVEEEVIEEIEEIVEEEPEVEEEVIEEIEEIVEEEPEIEEVIEEEPVIEEIVEEEPVVEEEVIEEEPVKEEAPESTPVLPILPRSISDTAETEDTTEDIITEEIEETVEETLEEVVEEVVNEETVENELVEEVPEEIELDPLAATTALGDVPEDTVDTEVVEEVEVEFETPLGASLPQTGVASSLLFYVIGAITMICGAVVIKIRK